MKTTVSISSIWGYNGLKIFFLIACMLQKSVLELLEKGTFMEKTFMPKIQQGKEPLKLMDNN